MLYTIFFLQRSGSTYLSEMLESIGLGRPREYYEPAAVAARTVGPAAYIKQWMNQGDVAGMKAEWIAYQQFLDEAAWLIPHLEQKYILITRRDKLRQAISWERAQQSGQWASDQRQTARPIYNRAGIQQKLGWIQYHEAAWRTFLTGKPHLHLEYEAINEQTAYDVADWLGVKTRGEARSTLRKQRDELTEEWVARFNNL